VLGFSPGEFLLTTVWVALVDLYSANMCRRENFLASFQGELIVFSKEKTFSDLHPLSPSS
jgi:hypothetical protein